jgi:hypothetical protein
MIGSQKWNFAKGKQKREMNYQRKVFREKELSVEIVFSLSFSRAQGKRQSRDPIHYPSL